MYTVVLQEQAQHDVIEDGQPVCREVRGWSGRPGRSLRNYLHPHNRDRQTFLSFFCDSVASTGLGVGGKLGELEVRESLTTALQRPWSR